MSKESGVRSKRRARIVAVALLAAAVAATAWAMWRRERPAQTARRPAEDPRLSFATPFLNVRPEVQYVGDDACAGCHPDIARTYRRHPMGRSLAPATGTSEPHDPGPRNPFEASGFHYGVERRGERVLHRETVTAAGGRRLIEKEVEVHFAVGSGSRGRSFLTHKDGYLTMSPITWYPQKQIWDLSPGYETNNAHFARSITPDCLFCHANRVEPIGGTENRYREPLFRGLSIGCERCHGPGELHLRRHRDGVPADEVDYTIVNPARLEHGLRESVCQQCHLQGRQRILRRGREWFDYRPGLPFHLFFSEFVTRPEPGQPRKFVGTVEQMYASRCFQESKGEHKLGCISCHDPHGQPEPDLAATFYRERCLSCHEAEPGGRSSRAAGCSLPEPARRNQQKDDSCTACHMPKTGSNVPHTAVTDHRILRRASGAAQAVAVQGPALLHFHHHLVRPDDAEIARDLGVALMVVAESEDDETGRALAEQALPLLEAALARSVDDAAAGEARANALWFLGRLEQAMNAFEQCLRAAPRRETALARAASLALRLDRPADARRYAEEALAVNPGRWQYHHELAAVLARQGDSPRALAAARQALEINPAAQASRRLLVELLVRAGRAEEAAAEFERLVAVTPADQHESLRSWFALLTPAR